ncbi:hypothetical protein K443DRAFT_582242 [Laccaria amethystina LaAM-08-1]|uniref:Uncharacterized protein n=1 Tax=Laccaria amethystina LaAM-08-1 TaxID=1095629 RepID=A0A0C9X7F6_9AGAR|nr:hypothetical protein K443DRAFT_582242 [Laccaria amethystina LaAM-08-1]
MQGRTILTKPQPAATTKRRRRRVAACTPASHHCHEAASQKLKICYEHYYLFDIRLVRSISPSPDQIRAKVHHGPSTPPSHALSPLVKHEDLEEQSSFYLHIAKERNVLFKVALYPPSRRCSSSCCSDPISLLSISRKSIPCLPVPSAASLSKAFSLLSPISAGTKV